MAYNVTTSVDSFVSGESLATDTATTTTQNANQTYTNESATTPTTGQQTIFQQAQQTPSAAPHVDAYVYQTQDVIQPVPVYTQTPPVYTVDTETAPLTDVPLEPLDTDDGGTNTDGTFNDGTNTGGGDLPGGDVTTPGGTTSPGTNIPRQNRNTTLTTLKPFLIIAALVGGAIVLGKLLKSES